MGSDEDFHSLATKFPKSVLALLGAKESGEYQGTSPVLKQSTRRVDVAIEPQGHGGPTYLVELYAHRNPDALRNLLEKLIGYCRQTGRWGRVEAALVFTRAEFSQGLLPVDAELRTRLRFRPLRFVLGDIPPTDLEAQGPEALVALPLVGRVSEVVRHARRWLDAVRAAWPQPQRQAVAVDLFIKLLALRVGDTLEIADLLGEEDVVKDTITGRRLVAEGERIMVEHQLRERLKEAAEPLLPRLAACDVDQIEQVGSLLIARELTDEELATALSRLLPEPA